jgi:DNA (cytosine-5)-methyltransferase 1
MITLVSLFSGAGGLDLGFKRAGFNIIWANENDKTIVPTFKKNFPNVTLDTRSIQTIDGSDIPCADGIIGGPPCQSWSIGGSKKGINDDRGKLFYEYIRILSHIKPKFFIAENVSGIINKRNILSFTYILNEFDKVGYDIFWEALDASDYEVPQNRKRVFVVGFRKDLNINFKFPDPIKEKTTLMDAIYDLKDIPCVSKAPKAAQYSYIFMSRNRVREWEEQSFTILASERHIPLHPQAPKMMNTSLKDKKMFVPGKEYLYRRLTVQECARIQTFPDDFSFVYELPRDGYKMIGNAVPVNMAFHLANKIKECLHTKEQH